MVRCYSAVNLLLCVLSFGAFASDKAKQDLSTSDQPHMIISHDGRMASPTAERLYAQIKADGGVIVPITKGIFGIYNFAPQTPEQHEAVIIFNRALINKKQKSCNLPFVQ
jgi:hypothetical protein